MGFVHSLDTNKCDKKGIWYTCHNVFITNKRKGNERAHYSR